MARVYQREGSGMWWVDFVDATGRRRRHPAAKKKRDAERILAEYVSRVNHREPLGILDQPKSRFDEVSAAYLSWLRENKKPSTHAIRERSVRIHLAPVFGDGYLRSITKEAISDFVAQRRRAGAKANTIRADLATLQGLLTFAVRQGFLLRSPMSGGLESRPRAEGHERALTREELQTLLAHIDGSDRPLGVPKPYLRAIVLVAVTSGLRRGEVLSLTPGIVDLKTGRVSLPDTKANKAQKRFVGSDGLVALRALPRPLRDQRWFDFRSDVVDRAFRIVADEAGLGGVRFHDLRHTFGSWLVEDGVSLRVVQELMGHSTIQLTERYAHVAEPTMRDAIATLSVSVLK